MHNGLTWITDCGITRIAHGHKMRTFFETTNDVFQFAGIGITVITLDFFFRKFQLQQKIPRHACVFTHDHITGFERFECPERDITEVSDRCGDNR